MKDASTRLASWLIQHCPDPDSDEPQRIELQTAKRLLALELGLASEKLSRTLTKLRTQQLIDVQGRSVTLLCPAWLAEFVRRKTEFPIDVENSWSASPACFPVNGGARPILNPDKFVESFRGKAIIEVPSCIFRGCA